MADTEERDKGAIMPSAEARGQFQVKDFVVLIPLLGSLLAMAWEVGQFIPTSGFWLFSLSEHLLAAVRALPFALIAAVGLIVGLAFFPSSEELGQHLFGQASEPWLRRKLLIGLTIFLAVPGIALIVAGFISRQASFFGGGVFIGGLAALFIARPKRASVYAFVFVCSLIETMGLAVDEMRGYLNARPNEVSTIYTKTATYSGKVIMSGERGLLFFRPDQNDFVFQRQDEIQRIEWPRFKLTN
jgi:hypothetical protein